MGESLGFRAFGVEEVDWKGERISSTRLWALGEILSSGESS